MKDLKEKFVEVERRVTALVSENADLRERVAELTRQLAEARQGSQELENFHGTKMHIREKIETILRSLEAAGGNK